MGSPVLAGPPFFCLHYSMTITDFRLFLISFLAAFREHMFDFYASCEAVARGLNPLKVPLVVLSEAENTNGGLILAMSPEAKRLFHLKANISRKHDL